MVLKRNVGGVPGQYIHERNWEKTDSVCSWSKGLIVPGWGTYAPLTHCPICFKRPKIWELRAWKLTVKSSTKPHSSCPYYNRSLLTKCCMPHLMKTRGNNKDILKIYLLLFFNPCGSVSWLLICLKRILHEVELCSKRFSTALYVDSFIYISCSLSRIGLLNFKIIENLKCSGMVWPEKRPTAICRAKCLWCFSSYSLVIHHTIARLSCLNLFIKSVIHTHTYIYENIKTQAYIQILLKFQAWTIVTESCKKNTKI